MRILQIPTGGLFSDGILSCITDYMVAMDKTDLDVRVLATNHAEEVPIQRVKQSGCKVISIPYRKTNIIKYFFFLYRYLVKEKIDIIHVHGSSAIMSIELIAARLAGCKVRIAHSHNTTCEHQRIDKFLRPFFNIAYTEAFACGYEAGKWMFGNRNFIVIPNGRDIKRYEYNAINRINFREKLKVPSDALVVGHVGRFNVQKNHEYLIRIFEELYANNKNVYLVLVGTGEKIDEIRNRVEKSMVRNNVIFTGEINNVSEYLSAFDVMLLPSLYEGLPMVVIEWQIAGLPCIVSDTVTNECAITPLVKFKSLKDSPAEWARDIQGIALSDRNSNKETIFNSIRKAGYDIKLGAKKLRELYFELVDYYK